MAETGQKHPSVRISAKTHRKIKQMADEDGVPMADVIDNAVERIRRERIARKANEVWADAMRDPELSSIWKSEDAEIERTFCSSIEDPDASPDRSDETQE